MQKLNSSASSGHAIFFHNDIKKIEKFKTQKVVKWNESISGDNF